MAIENQPIAPVSLNEEKPRSDEEQQLVEIADAVALGEDNEGILDLN